MNGSLDHSSCERSDPPMPPRTNILSAGKPSRKLMILFCLHISTLASLYFSETPASCSLKASRGSTDRSGASSPVRTTTNVPSPSRQALILSLSPPLGLKSISFMPLAFRVTSPDFTW